MKEMKTSKEIMRDLVDRLNYLTLKYDEGCPEVSDKEWDDLYFQLLDMENKAGMYYIDSMEFVYKSENHKIQQYLYLVKKGMTTSPSNKIISPIKDEVKS